MQASQRLLNRECERLVERRDPIEILDACKIKTKQSNEFTTSRMKEIVPAS